MLSLPGYSVDQILHQGRETVLYRATRDVDARKVAIKVSARSIPTPRDRARLRYEFELLRAIETEGIVQALALENSNLGLALVLELLSGQPLDEYLAAAKPNLRASLDLAILIVDVVSAVHRRHVVHKDLKPHHLFYDAASGCMRLLDFGIATRLGHVVGNAAISLGLEGTLAYLSPEQTGRVNVSVDRRSDLYSLGVVLYELFTGELPFSSIDPMELLYCHVARQPLTPYSRNPDIPQALSAIIMKLMAKVPEDRYQSALGLRSDLLECVRMLDQDGRISPSMRIGAHDLPYDLQLSHKLYGRDLEKAGLLRIFESVQKGSSELVLISGYSGVGKTALVAEVRKALMQQGGFFASGKFDQLNRSIPYSSLGHALRELVQQILAQEDAIVERWRQRLSAVLGATASSLVLIVPELEALLGTLPEAPTLGPAESQNRFDIAVDAMIRAFCQSGQPLVMFLDDLQWADHASLRLLQLLFGQGAPAGLMILGAYRDNEVDASHPLRITLGALARDGATLHEIKLQPLVVCDLIELLVDTFKLPAVEIASLAQCVFAKTQGNPFFAGQFVMALYRDGLVRLSTETMRWEWDVGEIQRQAVVTDNVIDFLAGRLKLLPATAQQSLKLAACVGHEFDLHTLSVICDLSSTLVLQTLNEALHEGMIQPLQFEHRYAAFMEEGGGDLTRATYRFVHDRVHEAAYALIGANERAEVHLRIGRLLLARLDAAGGSADDGADLFSVANHLNQGRALIGDSAERQRLSLLNRQAGERARAGAAFSTASDHYRIGLELLDAEGERADPSFRLELLLGFAESESLCGRFEQAELCFDTIDRLAPTVIVRAKAICLRLKSYQVAGRYREGVSLAERILRDLGVMLPGSREDANAAIGVEVGNIQRNLAGRDIEDLVDAPVVDDPRIRVTIEVLANAAPCAYIGQPEAFPFIALKMLNLSLEHGNTPASCFAYSVYGLMLVAVFGDIALGYRFSEMSIRLNEKFDDIRLRGTLLHLHGDHINFWKNHLRTDLPILERAFLACQQAGDYVYANYLAFETPWQVFELGTALEETLDHSEPFARFSRKTRNDAVHQTIRLEQQFFRCLMAKTPQPFVLSSPEFDVEATKKIIADSNFGCGVAFGHIIDLMLSYYRGDMVAARAAIEATVPLLGAVMAMPIEATFHFFRALTLAQSLMHNDPEASESDRSDWKTTMSGDIERLARWAAANPSTFGARYRIARGESLRVDGEPSAALLEYDAAIDVAETHGFGNHAALACELAAHCLLSVGRPRPAAFYFALAFRQHQHGGATALALRVERSLAPLHALLPVSPRDESAGLLPPSMQTITSHDITARLLDVASVLKAAQAIASEMEMERLLEQVMGIALTNSGAQRGVLVLSEHSRDSRDRIPGANTIVAIASADAERVHVGLSVPVDAHCRDLSPGVIGFVAHTRETLVATNPHEDSKFATDSYLQELKPRSLLCVPLVHQNNLAGLLYLENAIVHDAFTRERIELLKLLCAQVAIALENARLYEHARKASEALHGANTRLEAEVAERTAALHDANQRLIKRGDELDAINRRLQQELEERQRSEKERAALQDTIIGNQRTRLLEMGTPLIPISAEVVVMPLIGTVDEERANQILETALRGAQHTRAQFVILDVTGIHAVDHAVAESLVRTAQALQLLGAVAIITGIRADVAQILIGLDVDMDKIVCLSRLQDGIAWTQKRLRRNPAR